MHFFLKDDSPYWRTTSKHDCVVLSLSGKDWTRVSCDGAYPYICYQKPPSKNYSFLRQMTLVNGMFVEAYNLGSDCVKSRDLKQATITKFVSE